MGGRIGVERLLFKKSGSNLVGPVVKRLMLGG